MLQYRLCYVTTLPDILPSALALESLVVTYVPHYKILHSVHRVQKHILLGLWNKQCLLPGIALTAYFYNCGGMCLMCSLYRIFNYNFD